MKEEIRKYVYKAGEEILKINPYSTEDLKCEGVNNE